MDYGVCIFATDYAMRIDDLAREAEQRGFESLWVPEHTTFRPAGARPSREALSCPRSTGTPSTPSWH